MKQSERMPEKNEQLREKIESADASHTRKNSKILFLELGGGYNTPGIIKYSFWQMTVRNKNAEYVCINKGETSVPIEIKARSIAIDADIYDVLNYL